ncbi:MAG: hypothetical protein IT355_08195 [Gemmatimonadaceae bacterium]|nr:hypothetical protein [Gemmatimonadaceae bacterium]
MSTECLLWQWSLLARLVSVSSFFDASAEWLLALGCVLAVTTRSRRELESTNDELRRVQSTLRAMVDVDSLTGLARGMYDAKQQARGHVATRHA